eukprot:s1701_g5.t1
MRRGQQRHAPCAPAVILLCILLAADYSRAGFQQTASQDVTAASYSFDALSLSSTERERVLTELAERLEVATALQVPASSVQAYLDDCLQAMPPSNPYHGPSHVVDILQPGAEPDNTELFPCMPCASLCHACVPDAVCLSVVTQVSSDTAGRNRLGRLADSNRQEMLADYMGLMHLPQLLECSMHNLLETACKDQVLSPESRAALFLAGAAHDVDHTGTTNAFLVSLGHAYVEALDVVRATIHGTDLARHQQIVDSFSAEMEAAVTEEAVAAFFSLESLQGAGIHVLHGLSGTKLARDLRSVKPRRMVNNDSECSECSDGPRPAAMDTQANVVMRAILTLAEESTVIFNGMKYEGSTPGSCPVLRGQLLLQLLLKAGDVSNPTRPLATAKAWNSQVYQELPCEFYAEGDQVLSAGGKPNPLHDRRTNSIPKSSVGFIKWVKCIFNLLKEFLVRCLDAVLARLDENAASFAKDGQHMILRAQASVSQCLESDAVQQHALPSGQFSNFAECINTRTFLSCIRARKLPSWRLQTPPTRCPKSTPEGPSTFCDIADAGQGSRPSSSFGSKPAFAAMAETTTMTTAEEEMATKKRKVAPWPTLSAGGAGSNGGSAGGLFDGLPEAHAETVAVTNQHVPQVKKPVTSVRCLHLLKKHTKSRRPSSWRERVITRNIEEATYQVKELRKTIAAKSTPKERQAEFERLARKESDCSSARDGGSLGRFGRGQMQPAFEKARVEACARRRLSPQVGGILMRCALEDAVARADATAARAAPRMALAGFPPSRPKDGLSMCYFFLRLRVLGAEKAMGLPACWIWVTVMQSTLK